MTDTTIDTGLTAKTDEQIIKAIDTLDFSLPWHQEAYEYWRSSDARGVGNIPAKWTWEHRHGQPWQSAIESHVAAYRFPPRDLAGAADGMMLVESAMHKLGYRAMWNHFSDGWYVTFRQPKIRGKGNTGPDLPLAVARAAVAALTESEASNG